jgi:predicted TIM-barrel fold metal-dependent hydrolase
LSVALPDGACDAHCHVFGPAARFPFAPGRSYTPEDAPKEALMALHTRLGIDRGVIVQPAAHGFDNSVTLDAIAASDGRYRGVALVEGGVTQDELARLDAGGIRGVRFNFMPHLSAPPAVEVFQQIANRIALLGWHVVVHIGAGDLPMLDRYLPGLDIPLVIDHMARVPAQQGVDQPAFRQLLRLAEDPRAWIKISAADRVSATGAPFDDVLPFMRALAETVPDRLLWGTDWPHPNIKGPVPDEAVLLDLLTRALASPALLHQVLVKNPAKLYGFEPAIGSAATE